MVVRPVLPFVNYMVNYDYIVKNLCEKKDQPRSTCKGKCYVEKELAKTEKHSNIQTLKIPVMEAFISSEIFSFSDQGITEGFNKNQNNFYFHFFASEYFTRIFRPPLA